MRAIVVVVIFELVEFSIQIDSIPERNVLEVLFPDCTNDPLNKGVGHWYIGYRLDFVYILTSQVRLPAMTFEQRIIVGAQGHGRTGASVPHKALEAQLQVTDDDRSQLWEFASNVR